jgi:hypothetical protein
MNELGSYGDTGSFEPMLKVCNEAFSDYLGSSRETWELLDSAFKPGRKLYCDSQYVPT